MIKQPDIATKILDNPNERWGEIYMITCNVTNKKYIGQAVSHILNHKRFRPYGCKGRFRCHISEAYSNKKNQSSYLNNAIRKYGCEIFNVNLLEMCDVSNLDERENFYINEHLSMFPNGYNLRSGGQHFVHTTESRERVSKGVVNYFKEGKFQRFIDSDIKPCDIDIDDLDSHIHPLNRYKKQYGWYILIKGKKADFGGCHIDIQTSKENCYTFLKELKLRMATHLEAGNS